jgi:SAM-dependent methyltransferase
MQRIQDHNHFYLTEDRRLQPKEYFKFLVRQAAARLATPPVRVLDVGCAAGEFLYYLRSLYPNAALTGTDVTPEFLAKARQAVPDAEFVLSDIYSGANLPGGSFDVVFMSGVNVLFAEYEPWLRNLVSLTRHSAYVFGIFNPDDLDVRATVQRSGDNGSATGWNLISRKSIGLYLDSIRVPHRFLEWELPLAIPRSHDDPIRSWTMETSEGSFLAINGMQMVHRFAVLHIQTAP